MTHSCRLAALQNRDLAALARLTSYPFEVRDVRREALCGRRTATKPSELAAAVSCVLESAVLMQAMQGSPTWVVEAANETDEVPSWASGWWRKAEHGSMRQTFTGVRTRGGVEFDIILLVAPDGVRTFWKLGSFESND